MSNPTERTGATTLITGFEPFGEHTSNSSQLLVEALEKQARPGWVTAVLPTSFERAQTQLLDLLTSHQPSWCLHLGLAAGAEGLRFEEIASNWDESAATDNDGKRRSGALIQPGAPETYSSGLSAASLKTEADSAGESMTLSRDCGGFVCNHVFFRSSHYAAQAGRVGQVGFIHLPHLSVADRRLRSLTDIVAGWLRSMV